MSKERGSRRAFLKLGLAASGASVASSLSGCRPSSPDQGDTAQGDTAQRDADQKVPQGVDLEKWNRIKGEPYELGEFGAMPGVCQLPSPQAKRNWPDRNKYKDVETVPGMCQLCSTVCGITGYVKDGRLIKIEGNPNDPNSRGHLCARGQAGLNHLYHPERLLYPLKRVGKRGEGKWKRITWDEALDEIAAKLKAVRESGKPEEFAFHQGRQRSKDALKRFLDAFGTKTQLSHRALCSGNRRAANLTYLWESDWDLNDVEHSKYILNFGSNAFEAHQGHIPFANRIQNGRFKNGAKLVTFDVRLSNTAGGSDEWFAPFPGTDGAIALAMCHTIMAEDLHDAEFINAWTNITVEELRAHLAEYTPAWAEKISGMPAADIRRIAIEFAKSSTSGHDNVQPRQFRPHQWVLQRPRNSTAECDCGKCRKKGRMVLVAVGRIGPGCENATHAAWSQNLERPRRPARLPARQRLATHESRRIDLSLFAARPREAASLYDL